MSISLFMKMINFVKYVCSEQNLKTRYFKKSIFVPNVIKCIVKRKLSTKIRFGISDSVVMFRIRIRFRFRVPNATSTLKWVFRWGRDENSRHSCVKWYALNVGLKLYVYIFNLYWFLWKQHRKSKNSRLV